MSPLTECTRKLHLRMCPDVTAEGVETVAQLEALASKSGYRERRLDLAS